MQPTAWITLLAALPSTAAAPPGGLKLDVWKNSAMAGQPDQPLSVAEAPLSGAWPKELWSGVLTAEWSGSVTPTETANYFFNCSFDGGFGLGWVDGHVLCTQNMPLYQSNAGPGAIPLVAGKAYARPPRPLSPLCPPYPLCRCQ